MDGDDFETFLLETSGGIHFASILTFFTLTLYIFFRDGDTIVLRRFLPGFLAFGSHSVVGSFAGIWDLIQELGWGWPWEKMVKELLALVFGPRSWLVQSRFPGKRQDKAERRNGVDEGPELSVALDIQGSNQSGQTRPNKEKENSNPNTENMPS